MWSGGHGHVRAYCCACVESVRSPLAHQTHEAGELAAAAMKHCGCSVGPWQKPCPGAHWSVPGSPDQARQARSATYVRIEPVRLEWDCKMPTNELLGQGAAIAPLSMPEAHSQCFVAINMRQGCSSWSAGLGASWLRKACWHMHWHCTGMLPAGVPQLRGVPPAGWPCWASRCPSARSHSCRCPSHGGRSQPALHMST